MNIESRVADGQIAGPNDGNFAGDEHLSIPQRITSAHPPLQCSRCPSNPPSHVVIGAPPAIELPLQLRPLSVAGLSSPSAPIASFLHHQRVMQSIPWILPDNSTFSAPACAIVLPRQAARPSPPPSLRHMSNRQLYRFTCRAASSSLNGTSTCTVSKLIVP